MSHGLQVFNAAGVKTLDVSSRLTRLRYGAEVAAYSSGSIELPDIAGKNTFEMGLALDGDFAIAHLVTRSETTVTWEPRSIPERSRPSSATIVLVFLY